MENKEKRARKKKGGENLENRLAQRQNADVVDPIDHDLDSIWRSSINTKLKRRKIKTQVLLAIEEKQEEPPMTSARSE